MRKLTIGTIASITLTLSAVVHAAADSSIEPEQALGFKQMADCFKAHATLMEKPAGRNRFNCWMAHRHLMRS